MQYNWVTDIDDPLIHPSINGDPGQTQMGFEFIKIKVHTKNSIFGVLHVLV